MDILWLIIIGFVAGVVAKFVMPGRQGMGIIMTTLLGIAGAFVATWLGRVVGWYGEGESARFIGAVVGAVLLLVVYGFIRKKSA